MKLFPISIRRDMGHRKPKKTLIDEKPLSKPSSKPFKGTNIANMVFNTKEKQPP